LESPPMTSSSRHDASHGSNVLVSAGTLGAGLPRPPISMHAEALTRICACAIACVHSARELFYEFRAAISLFQKYLELAQQPGIRFKILFSVRSTVAQGDGRTKETAIFFPSVRTPHRRRRNGIPLPRREEPEGRATSSAALMNASFMTLSKPRPALSGLRFLPQAGGAGTTAGRYAVCPTRARRGLYPGLHNLCRCLYWLKSDTFVSPKHRSQWPNHGVGPGPERKWLAHFFAFGMRDARMSPLLLITLPFRS
jgi:hypothetical protein